MCSGAPFPQAPSSVDAPLSVPFELPADDLVEQRRTLHEIRAFRGDHMHDRAAAST